MRFLVGFVQNWRFHTILQPPRLRYRCCFGRVVTAISFGWSMQSSGEGEWLRRSFHSAVRACFAAGLPDVAPQATFTSLRAEHWTRLGDVTPEDASALGKLERHSEGAREAAFQAHAELVWRAAVS